MADLSRIGIGTVQFGLNYGISNTSGQTSDKEVSDILGFCLERGINTLDTASAYGDSEKVLGQFRSDRFEIVSKFLASEPAGIKSEIKQTLKNLQTDSIYGYLFHRTGHFSKENWDTLRKFKDEGLVKKIGFSLSEESDVEILRQNEVIPDLIQAPVNILDRRFRKCLEHLCANGTEIHARSVFLQGLFFLSGEVLEKQFKPVKDFVLGLQEKFGEHLPLYLIHQVLEFDYVDKVILGVNHLDQLKLNLQVFDFNFEDFELNIPTVISEEIVNPSLWGKN